MTPEIHTYIDTTVKSNKVVLFMKGTAAVPMCGFSSMVVQVLNLLKVGFVDVNVMANQNLREGIKVYSDWPTIPQLYVDGTFIGGCDIVRELYQSGELQTLLAPFVDKAGDHTAADKDHG